MAEYETQPNGFKSQAGFWLGLNLVCTGGSAVEFLPSTREIRVQFPANASCSHQVWASLVAQMVKNLPAMLETSVQFLGWEDPSEEGKATHSSILAWKIPMDRGAWQATAHGVVKSQTRLNN